MRVFTPDDIKERAANKYLGVLVAAKQARMLNEFPRERSSREKKLTNIRSSTAEEAIRLVPPRPMGLEDALAFVAEDELVEVTPLAIRIRKRVLPKQQRPKWNLKA